MHILKRVSVRGRATHIITQNENGPCPLIAVCNTLMLSGVSAAGQMLHERLCNAHSVSSRSLADWLAEYLLSSCDRILETDEFEAFDAACALLTRLHAGLNVDPRFQSVDDFAWGDERHLFGLLGVRLVHGWILDPQDAQQQKLRGISYNQLTDQLVALAESTSKRRDSSDSSDSSLEYKAEFRHAVEARFNEWSTRQYTDNQHLYEIGHTAREEQRSRIREEVDGASIPLHNTHTLVALLVTHTRLLTATCAHPLAHSHMRLPLCSYRRAHALVRMPSYSCPVARAPVCHRPVLHSSTMSGSSPVEACTTMRHSLPALARALGTRWQVVVWSPRARCRRAPRLATAAPVAAATLMAAAATAIASAVARWTGHWQSGGSSPPPLR